MKVTVYKTPKECGDRDYDLTWRSVTELRDSLLDHCKLVGVSPLDSAIRAEGKALKNFGDSKTLFAVATELLELQGRGSSEEEGTNAQGPCNPVNSTNKYKLFRNFMVNELGISRDDIKEWTMQAVKETVQKELRGVDVATLARDSVRHEVNRYGFTNEVLTAAVEKIVNETLDIRIDVKGGVGK